MPKESVVFLHGWHGDESTYGKLPNVLAQAGYESRHVYLGEYVTGWDDITIDDLAIAFQSGLIKQKILERGPFHCIVHSSGALVARNWVHRFYSGQKKQELPMRHMVMAAPANNGSRLAAWGKKLPWDWGNHILKALELASPLSWDLNRVWMAEGYTDIATFFPTLLIGGNNDQDLPWYVETFDRAIGRMEKDVPVFEEEGSDNTVRGCAANLNMEYLRYEAGGNEPVVQSAMGGMPVWYFSKYSHSGKKQGILRSIESKNHPVAQAVLKILAVTDKADPVYARQEKRLPAEYPYAMVNVRVADQLGNPVPEAMVWWYSEPKDALEMRHTHDGGEIVCFYVNKKKGLRRAGFYVDAPKRGGSLLYPLRWEYERSAALELYRAGEVDLMPSGQTTFVEVVLKKGMGEKVLKLKALG